MQRTKTVNRKKLSDGKDGETHAYRPAAPKGNMMSFTGQEANGW